MAYVDYDDYDDEIETVNGFAVEIGKQVLLSGDWNSDDCDWEWEFDDRFFSNRDDAEEYFANVKWMYSNDYPLIRLSHCEMDVAPDGGVIGYTFGDTIKEYGNDDDGGVVVYEY